MLEKNKSLNFQIVGSPKKPLVTFLHGFMGSGEDWLPVVRPLAADFCALLIDLPGHGKSSNMTNFNDLLSAIADIILSITNSTRIVGYSLGGRLAMQLALAQANLINRLIIESSNPGIEDRAEQEKREESDLHLFAHVNSPSSFNSFLSAWYANPIFGALSSKGLIPQRNFSIAQVERWQKSLAILSLGVMPSLWTKLNQLPSTAYISGSMDEKYSAIGKRLATNFLHIENIIFNDCGHNCHLEMPEKFINILLKALGPTP